LLENIFLYINRIRLDHAEEVTYARSNMYSLERIKSRTPLERNPWKTKNTKMVWKKVIKKKNTVVKKNTEMNEIQAKKEKSYTEIKAENKEKSNIQINLIPKSNIKIETKRADKDQNQTMCNDEGDHWIVRMGNGTGIVRECYKCHKKLKWRTNSCEHCKKIFCPKCKWVKINNYRKRKFVCNRPDLPDKGISSSIKRWKEIKKPSISLKDVINEQEKETPLQRKRPTQRDKTSSTGKDMEDLEKQSELEELQKEWAVDAEEDTQEQNNNEKDRTPSKGSRKSKRKKNKRKQEREKQINASKTEMEKIAEIIRETRARSEKAELENCKKEEKYFEETNEGVKILDLYAALT